MRNVIQLFGQSCQPHLWEDASHKIQCFSQSTRKWNSRGTSRQDFLTILVRWTNSEGICIIEIISYCCSSTATDADFCIKGCVHLLPCCHVPLIYLKWPFFTFIIVIILHYFSTVTDKLADPKKLLICILEVLNWISARTVSILRFFVVFSAYLDCPKDRTLTLILRRSCTGTVWFYTSTSNKRAARPKLYTKSLTMDLKLMYSRLTLVRISINL